MDEIRVLILDKINGKFGSQAKFAKKVGVSEGFVSMVVNGKKDLTPEHAGKWGKVLNIHSDKFIKITMVNKQLWVVKKNELLLEAFNLLKKCHESVFLLDTDEIGGYDLMEEIVENLGLDGIDSIED